MSHIYIEQLYKMFFHIIYLFLNNAILLITQLQVISYELF